MVPSISDIIRETVSSGPGPRPIKPTRIHPLDQITVEEIDRACNIAKKNRPNQHLWIKVCTLREPPKALLAPYLEAERRGEQPARPARLADVLFFVLETKELVEVIVDIDKDEEVKSFLVKTHHAPIDREELGIAKGEVVKTTEYAAVVKELDLGNTEIVLQPWPYGADDIHDHPRRLFFILYHRNPKTNHPDSNHYAFPLPVTISWDLWEKKVTAVDWCYTGGEKDSFVKDTSARAGFTAGCQPGEYMPELRENKPRDDLKPLHVSQPEGVSFKVTGQLLEWQKWRFRLSFNYREGPVLHDVTYDGRPLFYRISLSEMHVPYADPRPLLNLRQVFDFGDIGLGRSANSLENGCDCLGVMHYMDTAEVDSKGTGRVVKNVVCIHEQDNGILWKHTNTPTGRAAVTRQRLLVVQTIITVGNYDYIFAWHFDQAGALHLESRATGILSTGPIDLGKKSIYGTVVSPGVLGTSHQHFINLRIDPSIDGHKNTIVQEDVVPMPFSEENSSGIAFTVEQTPITKSGFADANPLKGRSFKITNPNVINPVSMTPVSYKLVPHPSQLRLAHPDAMITSRAPFTQHHIWVTKYADGELFCAGQYTNQSNGKAGGVKEWTERGDNVENEDLVLWHTFGLTHVPRVEDFPVMPVETHTITLKPCNFFTENPAMDVPLSNQAFNKSTTVDLGSVDANQCCAGNGL
ncbi:hypothetical protein CI109_105447 [Kwoniella shandongensis]|uniref:Amine oxidase n=1 Tax=Kwoniella shandongensis TaxID=1734106 RepID=A0A5M6C2C2_9TREE|nr:uncharacterized protein CI109_002168 [Kwoniella shandongensis]KAA5529277.1 hypothetical protein CI109_002168 [Kwoniella shandongensis]